MANTAFHNFLSRAKNRVLGPLLDYKRAQAGNQSFQDKASYIARVEALNVSLEKSRAAIKSLNDRNDKLKASLFETRKLLRDVKSKKVSLEKSRAAIKSLNDRNDKLKASLFETRKLLKDIKSQRNNPNKGNALRRGGGNDKQDKAPDQKTHRIIESSIARNVKGFHPKIVAEAAMPWCKFGVRDPFFLVDEHGRPVLHEGQYLMFFSGRDRSLVEGGNTAIGVMRSADFVNWHIDERPIFEDGSYATSGSIVKLPDGTIRLYYAFDTARGFRIAETNDLKTWKIRNTPFAEPRQFHCRRIGLPHVFKHGDKWFVVFEGLRRHFNIYGMQSADGISWSPLHEGQPVYLPSSSGWDSLAQANPSVVHIDGELHLAYNGYESPGSWDIGLRKFEFPEEQLHHSGDMPLLARSDLKSVEASRLEGARIFNNMMNGCDQLFFFDLPTADGFAGGRIWQSNFDHLVSNSMYADAANSVCEGEVMSPQPNFIDARDADIEREPNDIDQSEKNIGAEEEFNDKFAETYFDVWDHQPIQRITKTVEEKWIRNLIKPGDSVLVVGSGGGREIECLLDIGAKITAMDISPKMLEIGAARYPDADIQWIHADAQRPPDSLTGFDHALAIGLVLCYLPNPELALANLRDTVKTGGTLTLGVVNAEHFTELNPRKYLNSGRVRFAYSVSELKGMLQRAGYLVTEVNANRFFIDGLPNEWNKPEAATQNQLNLINQLADLELEFSAELEPELAKHLWVSARAI